jgi:cobalt-zinc-cadmium efflux system protein
VATHTHASDPAGRSLKDAFVLTLGILLVESGAGLWAHSLALLADAGHILTDVAALGLAWFAVEQAKRPADARRTYGYQRVGVLTAMINGATLLAVVAFVVVEAVQRWSRPQPVQSGWVIASAMLAILVNSYITVRLKGDDEHNINIRAALLHVIGDLAASAGVVVSGVIILLTAWYPIDAIASLFIAALIAWGAARLMLDTWNTLLEGVPRGVQLDAVREAIGKAPGVASFHDLHVWELAHEQVALSVHLVVSEERLSEGEHLVRRLEQSLCSDFGIGHTTIQVEACHQCEGPETHSPGEHNHPHVERLLDQGQAVQH